MSADFRDDEFICPGCQQNVGPILHVTGCPICGHGEHAFGSDEDEDEDEDYVYPHDYGSDGRRLREGDEDELTDEERDKIIPSCPTCGHRETTESTVDWRRDFRGNPILINFRGTCAHCQGKIYLQP